MAQQSFLSNIIKVTKQRYERIVNGQDAEYAYDPTAIYMIVGEKNVSASGLQELSEEEKQIARENIGSSSLIDGSAEFKASVEQLTFTIDELLQDEQLRALQIKKLKQDLSLASFIHTLGFNSNNITITDTLTTQGQITTLTAEGYFAAIGDYLTSPFMRKGFENFEVTANTHLKNIAQGKAAIALGVGCEASHVAAYAEGVKSKATALGAHAEGGKTVASAEYAHAEGTQTTASGQYSHSEGAATQARGTYSHAEGGATIAQGDTSHAEGLGTRAEGQQAHSEGYFTMASGTNSHAEGQSTQSTGIGTHSEGISTLASHTGAHAEGNASQAKNVYAHAEGSETEASGENAHSEGSKTKASGKHAHAEGNTTEASGESSHAEGQGSKAVNVVTHAEGVNTVAMGVASHAEGNATVAPGHNSHAEGSGSVASGSNSHAEGLNTSASGDTTHAEGKNTQARQLGAHAEGIETIAGDISTSTNGRVSHAEGFQTKALGTYSHTEGYQTQTTAQATSAHAQGEGTIANAKAQFVFGRYNVSSGSKVEVVGWGTSDTDRKNIRTLDNSGSEILAGNLTASRLISNVAEGKSPIKVTSTTKVDNLNADLLDGHDASYFEGLFAANDAMIFKGVLNSASAVPPSEYSAGWTYKIGTAGTYAGNKCEVGDILIAITDAVSGQTTINNAHWSAIQTNLDGAVTGPATATTNHIATFDDNTGKVIKDSGFTIGTNVPPNAVFTDTTYTFDGAVSTIKDDNLTANKVLISDGNGKVAASDITLTELNYLDNVTSNVQNQLDDKLNKYTRYSHPRGEIYGVDRSGQKIFQLCCDLTPKNAIVVTDSQGKIPERTLPEKVVTKDETGSVEISGGITVGDAVSLVYNKTTKCLNFNFN